METRSTRWRAEGWFSIAADGAIGGLLGWSPLELLGRLFEALRLGLAELVLIGVVSTALGRATRRFASRNP